MLSDYKSDDITLYLALFLPFKILMSLPAPHTLGEISGKCIVWPVWFEPCWRLHFLFLLCTDPTAFVSVLKFVMLL